MTKYKLILLLTATLLLTSACVHKETPDSKVSATSETDERSPASFRRKNLRRPVDVQRLVAEKLNRLIYGKRDETSAIAPAPVPTPFQSLFGAEDPIKINSCIVATCGPATQNWNASSVINRPGTNLTTVKLWDNDLKPKLQALLEREKQNDIESAQKMASLIHSGLTIQPGQPLKALVGFTQMMGAMNSHITKFYTYNPSYGYYLNLTEVEAAVQSVPPANQAAAQIMIKKAILPLLAQAFIPQSLLTNPLTSRLQAKYPGKTIKEAQQIDATTLLDSAARLQIALGRKITDNFVDEASIKLFKRVQSGEDLKKYESQNYIDDAGSIEFFGAIYDGGEVYQALMDLPIDLNKQLNDARQSQFIEAKLQEATTRDLNLRLTKIEVDCGWRIQAALNLNASQLRLRQARDMADNVKAAAQKMISQTELGSPEIIEEIGKIEYSMPDSNSELINTIRNAYQNTDNSISRSETFAKIQSPEMDQSLLQVIVAISTTNQKSDEEEVGTASKIRSACKSLPVTTISDYTLTSQGKIAVSWYSAAYPEVGVSIFAHEVGHVVSHKLRAMQVAGSLQQAFSDSLSCVANRNPFVITPVALSKTDNTVWSEEDWADHFSSMTMNYMTQTKNRWASTKNKACALVDNYNGQYAERTLQPGANDPHSSGILRLLMVGTDRQSLPQACAELLSYAPANHRELNCK